MIPGSTIKLIENLTSLDEPKLNKRSNLFISKLILEDYFIMGGIILLSIGLVSILAWNKSFQDSLEESIVLDEVPINGSQNLNRSIVVFSELRPVTLAVKIDSKNASFHGKILDQQGSLITSKNFSTDIFQSFKPESTGTYTLNIQNTGAGKSVVSVLFGHFLTIDSQTTDIDYRSLYSLMVGTFFLYCGFLFLAMGIGLHAVYVIEKWK